MHASPRGSLSFVKVPWSRTRHRCRLRCPISTPRRFCPRRSCHSEESDDRSVPDSSSPRLVIRAIARTCTPISSTSIGWSRTSFATSGSKDAAIEGTVVGTNMVLPSTRLYARHFEFRTNFVATSPRTATAPTSDTHTQIRKWSFGTNFTRYNDYEAWNVSPEATELREELAARANEPYRGRSPRHTSSRRASLRLPAAWSDRAATPRRSGLFPPPPADPPVAAAREPSPAQRWLAETPVITEIMDVDDEPAVDYTEADPRAHGCMGQRMDQPGLFRSCPAPPPITAPPASDPYTCVLRSVPQQLSQLDRFPVMTRAEHPSTTSGTTRPTPRPRGTTTTSRFWLRISEP